MLSASLRLSYRCVARLWGWPLVVACLAAPAMGQPNGKADDAKGQEAKEPDAKEAPANGQLEEIPAPGVVHTLGECLQIARERSPVLKAANASLQAAQAGLQGIDKAARVIHTLLAPDLKYRQQQARNGVTAAEAVVMQSEYDVAYEVIRNYYTVVYAREQLKVTTDLVTQLSVYLDFVRDAVKEGLRGITLNTQNQLEIYLGEARSRQIQARRGYDRALRALAHEMSVGPDYRFDVADRVLPEPRAPGLTRDAVVSHALSRRGEITLASVGAEVLRLEVCAQGAIRLRLRSFTAASASDVHSHGIPQGTRDGEYRPGGIPPEYPVLVVGDRKSRVLKAEALSLRADAVYEKTRDLVILEAENGFLRWLEATERVDELKKTAQSARDLIARSRKDANGKFTDEKQLQYEALSARAIGDYNEALYQQIQALAALERITAGGVWIPFTGR